MNFSPQEIDQLNAEYSLLCVKYFDVVKLYMAHSFSEVRAKEFASQGFLRRIRVLTRCIQNIYSIYPPNRIEKLSENEQSDLNINLQSFVFNVFGCTDNLAWIFVEEKGIEIEKRKVGLLSECKTLRAEFSTEFKKYMETLDNWFRYLKDFRDALAHRIPLYVPPSVLVKKDRTKWEQLEGKIQAATQNFRFDEVEKLHAEQDSLGTVSLWMMHSLGKKSEPVAFHSQVLADWNTICELSVEFLKELDRHSIA